ncbi:hypothetical protein [Mycobacterium shigaense]|uniref:hypothetical protein n=1 Tax=Mycobacterium shigaense TaxID=722731 RepID=UPI000E571B44|nr:hypothetical protein [Mycobacterium shigaense]MEA1121153.1 hypothetical protein [Mycobacterium shigaense]
MNSTTTKIVHRLRQARVVILRAQLAVTGAQLLLWVALIGVLVGLGTRVLGRRRHARANAVASTTPVTGFPASTDQEGAVEPTDLGKAAPSR